MLESLKVSNYALIDELQVSFHRGLNIITGETGAGKSILLGAMGLILGNRADTGVLSQADKKCIVEAGFNIEGYSLQNLFSEYDIDFEQHTIIRREILPNGKSRAFINDTPVTLNTLQEICLRLVDIHSQHQNLLLNHQNFLLGMIDKFCRHEDLMRNYQTAFVQYKNSRQEYEKARAEYEAIKTEFDFLSFQVNELNSAQFTVGEEEELALELMTLEHASDIKSALHEANNLIAIDELGVLDMLKKAESLLGRIEKVYPEASAFHTRLDSARVELKELATDLARSFEHLDFDPERCAAVKARLDILNGLIQKYRVASLRELMPISEELNRKLNLGIDGGLELNKLREKMLALEKDALDLSLQLTESRKKAFIPFQSGVEQTLAELGIAHAKLEIQHSSQPLSLSGSDQVAFLFSANKNHPLKDVSRIASGGELSRLMLSIKALLHSSAGMPTIILDEIDTGVSGEIADKVGNIIRSMSRGMQVINITHLPQVASKAEAHYKVFKSHEKNQTITLIKKLNEQEQLHEIAKMLSGEELSEAAIENARVLLKS
ncbi:MAG: DNA repair protein RecN [Bacteroidota bacterium]|nr:MAG: DNA repair protein RecN [Bacteroidota bacterium]